MEIETALEFVKDHHRAVLMTTRADGSPQMSPVVVASGPDGTLIVSSRETAAKTRNAERQAAVSICVFTDNFFGDWLQVDGSARVLKLPEALDGLIEYYRAISGDHPDWDEYRQAMVAERRVLLSITPTRVGPDRRG